MLQLHAGHLGPQALISDEDLKSYLHLTDIDVATIASSVPHVVLPSGRQVYVGERLQEFFRGATADAQP